jgi:hypothetical protein
VNINRQRVAQFVIGRKRALKVAGIVVAAICVWGAGHDAGVASHKDTTGQSSTPVASVTETVHVPTPVPFKYPCQEDEVMDLNGHCYANENINGSITLLPK